MFLYSKTLQEDPETIYEALFSYVLHNFIKTTTIVNKCLFLAKALCQVRLSENIYFNEKKKVSVVYLFIFWNKSVWKS